MNPKALLLSIVILIFIFTATATAQPPTQAKADPNAKITLQLKQSEIEDVLRTLSEKSGYNIVAEAGVKGRVTLYLEDVKTMEALNIMCDLYKLAYVKHGKTIMVYTEASYQAIYGKRFNDPVKTRVFDIEHVQVDVVAAQLTPLRSKDGRTIVDPRTNVLIISDVPSVLDEIAETIEMLDVPASSRSFVLKHATPATINEVITPYLSRSAIVTLDPSTNTIIVTDALASIVKIEPIIESFDREPATVTSSLELQYADVETVLTQLTDKVTPNVGTIQADKRTNSLIVTDLPSVVDHLREVALALDQKPREVLVQAKIVTVAMDESNKMGVNWEAIVEDIDNNDFNVKSKFKVLGDTDDGVTVTGGSLEEDNYTALFEALSTYGRAELLSSPQLLVLNNTEARILVGSTVPYKTVDTREENGSIRTFEKVTIIDVGVKLFVTPTINSDSVVTLKIRPEISSVTGFSDNVPVVEKSETETVVMVNDGVTVLIAGLVREETQKTVKGIPLLSKIPILGIPFRSTSIQKKKSELAILLTPHIVNGELPEHSMSIKP